MIPPDLKLTHVTTAKLPCDVQMYELDLSLES